MVKQEGIELDSILAELGQFGRYQIQIYCWIFLPILFNAIYNSQYIFNAAAVDHRCVVPECESYPPAFVPGEWGAWALPEGRGSCERLVPVYDGCQPDSFSLNETEKCSIWVYENNDSIVSEFDLACQEWKRTLVGTMHGAGLFAALIFTGYISDTFGRRTAFILTSVAAGAVGIIRSFSTNYVMYIVLEFGEATLGSGSYSTGFILALEMVGLNRRVIGGNLIASIFAIGQVVLALVAWAVPYWRNLTRVIYAPSLLFILYYFVIEESVRWLLSSGDKKEAVRIIYKAAAINKKKLSLETIQYLESDEKPKEQVEKTPKESETHQHSLFGEVIRSRIIMTRLVICWVWWITLTFIYYGLSINSVSLAGNKYVNYILTSLVEIPGYAISIVTLDRFGRKRSIITAFGICGVALIILPFVPSHLQWLATSLSLLGKLSISMAFSSIYIYTSELFPTSARHRLLACCSMFGRIGGLVAPQTPLLMAYMESLPYLLFGAMAISSALLMLLTPETLNLPLPDTVAQAEEISKRRKEHRDLTANAANHI